MANLTSSQHGEIIPVPRPIRLTAASEREILNNAIARSTSRLEFLPDVVLQAIANCFISALEPEQSKIYPYGGPTIPKWWNPMVPYNWPSKLYYDQLKTLLLHILHDKSISTDTLQHAVDRHDSLSKREELYTIFNDRRQILLQIDLHGSGIFTGQEIISQFRENTGYFPYYNLPPWKDGYYYCPEKCGHPPTTDANMHKAHLDCHLQPYKCFLCDPPRKFYGDATRFGYHLREQHEFTLGVD